MRRAPVNGRGKGERPLGTISRRVSPAVAAALTSSRTRTLLRIVAEARRRLRGDPHRIVYFHQADDPYSHLAAQILDALGERYDVVLEPALVGPPSDTAAPERERLEAFARRDAADVAPGYGLSFPATARVPDRSAVRLAERLLESAIAAGSFARFARRVGDALWSADASGLEALAKETGIADETRTRSSIEEGNRRREQLGHYLGAMFHYGGEWYWGVDRLTHLERRLRALGLARPGVPGAPLVERPVFPDRPPASKQRFKLEFYVSLRSPYTAIVFDRVLALCDRLPVDLVLRPVLPMVMRGLPVPAAKRLYITLDTKREAEDAGVAFGRVADPVGRPVERAFSLWPFARSKGRGAEWLREFLVASFADGIDTGTDAGLRLVAERAGLEWDDALPHLDREGWRDELEGNRERLLALGLWGVPSFHLLAGEGESAYSTWGQDRLWRVEAEIRSRIG
ncbi:hypothetical protein MYXO_01008 [Myxococcaceae bacterium]|nr:hypothetical protein MYXO_01008 [Myxococcaceae bacterium]